MGNEMILHGKFDCVLFVIKSEFFSSFMDSLHFLSPFIPWQIQSIVFRRVLGYLKASFLHWQASPAGQCALPGPLSCQIQVAPKIRLSPFRMFLKIVAMLIRSPHPLKNWRPLPSLTTRRPRLKNTKWLLKNTKWLLKTRLPGTVTRSWGLPSVGGRPLAGLPNTSSTPAGCCFWGPTE